MPHRRIHWARPLWYIHMPGPSPPACISHIFLDPSRLILLTSTSEAESRSQFPPAFRLPPSASPSAPALRIRVVLLPTPRYCSLFAIDVPSISALDILLMSVPTCPVFAIYSCLRSLFSFPQLCSKSLNCSTVLVHSVTS